MRDEASRDLIASRILFGFAGKFGLFPFLFAAMVVVPLVEHLTDFEITADDNDTDHLLFRIGLRTPGDMLRAAVRALESSREQECDIVVFPELCFTPDMQQEVSKWLGRMATERPWLVVAGSAHTPIVTPKTGFHNKALVFDKTGIPVLSHHKLHRYEMSTGEEDRYGLGHVLGYANRTEDMVRSPYEIEVLDTPVGRFAVLICEDLSVEDFVRPLIVNLGLDWLLVPILDGCQTHWRWPARYGKKYAERGACVVIATSLSLVERHLRSGELPDGTPAGVGLVVVPTSRLEPEVLVSKGHDQVAVYDVQ